MTWLLQITDCHLVASGERLLGVDTQASLEAVLTQACSERLPHAVLASGDLAHTPSLAIYQRFLTTVRAFTDAPLQCLPGNHDVLAAMQAASLPMQPLPLGAWALIPLDTHKDDAPAALITADDMASTLDWLRASSAEHVLLTSHHPWCQVGAPWLDGDRVPEPERRLDELQQASGRIRAVTFGHAHQEVVAECELEQGPLPVYGAPSTCFQFAPRSERFSIDAAAPGYRWWQLMDDGVWSTTVGRVDHFPMQVQMPKL